MLTRRLAVLVLGTVTLTSLNGCSFDERTSRAFTSMVSPEVSLGLSDVVADGVRYRYAVCTPGKLPDSLMPCIVFLHGRGECGVDGFKPCTVGLVSAAMMSAPHKPCSVNPASAAAPQVFSRDAPPAPSPPPGWERFIIIAPQKPEFDQTWEQHARMVKACLDHAASTLAITHGVQIDPARTYLTGLSQGGAGTWAIAALYPDLFAAIAPVCGFVHEPGGPAPSAPPPPPSAGESPKRREIAAALARARVPVWAFHGDKDDAVLPAHTRAMIKALNDAGWDAADDVKATFVPGANHNSWDAAYRDHGAELAEWFLAHAKPTGSPIASP